MNERIAPARKNTLSLFKAVLLLSCLLSPSHAFAAACGSPGGNTGDIIFSSSTGNMYFCNGSSWVQMGMSAGFGTLTTNDFCTATSSVQISCTTAGVSLATQVTGVLPAASGGTGVNNGINTITLGSSLVTSGAFGLTLTTVGTTSVTLPTSGTLVNTGVTTLSSLASIGTITTGVWNGTLIGAQYGGTGLNTMTSNVIYKGNGTGAMAISGLTDNGTIVSTSENLDLTSKAAVTEITNAGTTGTTVSKLAKLSSGNAVITAIADTDGVIGIVTGGAGTTGSAQLAVAGQASCIFDGATTAGDYVTLSTTVAGDCKDAGATRPTGSQTIGRVLSTNASGGTYAMALALNGAGGGGTVTLGTSLTALNPAKSGEATTGLYSDATGTVEVAGLGTQLMSISSTKTYIPLGSVGIGTSTPGSPLDIHVDSSTVPGLSIGTGGNNPNFLSFAGGRAMVGYANSGINYLVLQATSGKGIQFWVNGATNNTLQSGTQAMAIGSTGVVGIGTATPASNAKLDVYGSIYVNGGNAYTLPTNDSTSGASIAIGSGALAGQTGASAAYYNTAVGYQAMGNGTLTTAGTTNTAVGYQAMYKSTSATSNTAIGAQALMNDTSGSYNTAVGQGALFNNTTSCCNSALGQNALGSNTTGGGNSAFGNGTLANTTIGGSNTGVGQGTLSANISGAGNTAIGNGTLTIGTNGSNNTVIGEAVASGTLANGNNNILIGTDNTLDTPSSSTSNWMNIGNVIYGTNLTNSWNPGNVPQIGLGSNLTSITAGAVLDLSSNNKSSNSSLLLPVGSTGTRPTGVNGMIRYNTTTPAVEAFVNGSWTSLGGGSASLSGLSDVTLTSPASGNILSYNGTKWVNSTVGTAVTAAIAPSFIVNMGNVNQTTSAANASQKIAFNTKVFDTIGAFNTSTYRYTPTVAGTYLFHLQIHCGANANYCQASIFKNGGLSTFSSVYDSAGAGQSLDHSTMIYQMNGTTDYVEFDANTFGGTTLDGNASLTYGMGAMLAPLSSGSVAGTGTTNYLPVWSSSTTLTSSVIAQGTTGTNIGVGTASPAATVDIYSASAATSINLKNTNAGSAYGLSIIGLAGSGTGGVYNSSSGGNVYGMYIAGNSSFTGGVKTASGDTTGSAYGINLEGNGGMAVWGYNNAYGIALTNGAVYDNNGTGGGAYGFAIIGGSSNPAVWSNVAAPAYGVYLGYSSNAAVRSGGAGAYGLYIATSAVSSSASNSAWGIYEQDTALPNYFGGKVGIGSTIPAASLDLGQKTDAIILPVGTTGTRPTGVNGMIRYNTTTPAVEAFVNGSWTSLGAGGAAALSGLSDVTLTSPASGNVLSYNGSKWVNSTVASSVTAAIAPSFSVNNAANTQTVTANSWTKVVLGTTVFDTISGWSTSNNRYTPTIAGKYIFSGNIYCGAVSGTSMCIAGVAKNGTLVANGNNVPVASASASTVSVIVDLNGTTDYVEFMAFNQTGTSLGANATVDYFNGALLAPLASGSVAGTGTANYLPVWSSSTTLTSSVIAQSGSSIGIGTAAPPNAFSLYTTTDTTPGHIIGDNVSNVAFEIDGYIASSNQGGGFTGRFARGTYAAPAAVQTGDRIGYISFGGYNGAAFTNSVAVEGHADAGTISATSMPSYLAFLTTPNGSVTRAEQMRIDENGKVGIGTTAPVSALDLSQKTDALALPVGTTGTRPTTGVNGMIRYNTTTPAVEAFVNGSWTSLGGGGSATLGTSASAANPARASEGNTGLYSANSGEVDVSSLGTQVAAFTSTGINIATGGLKIAGINGISFPPDLQPYDSIAIGYQALAHQALGTGAQQNLAIGYGSMSSAAMTTGATGNTAIGHSTLLNITSGQDNVALGGESLYTTSSGSRNVSAGKQSLENNTSGTGNVAFGMRAGSGVTTGSDNIIIGEYDYNTGLTTGSYNILIGNDVLPPSATSDKQLNIGNLIYGTNLGIMASISTGSVGIGSSAPRASLDLSQSTNAVLLPIGSTGTRPTGVNGMIRYNTTTPAVEAFVNGSWTSLGTGGAVALSGLSDVTLTSPASGNILAYNGSKWVNSTVASSVTAAIAPSFSANNGSTIQTVTAGVYTKMTLGTVSFDTINGWSTSNNRYTPTVAGKYLFTGSVICSTSTSLCAAYIQKNGSYAAGGSNVNTAGTALSVVSVILDMNGTSDYVELWGVSSTSTSMGGAAANQRLDGALLAPLASGSVAGTGITNYVPLWSSSTTIGTSVITQSSGNVGIGTATPNALLHLNAGSTFNPSTPAYSNNQMELGSIVMTGWTANGLAFSNSTTGTGFSLIGENGDSLYFGHTSGSTATALMSISSSGQMAIGMGTAAPFNTLTVAGNGTGRAQIGDVGCSNNYTGISLNETSTSTGCASYNLASSPTTGDLYINRPTGHLIGFREANGTTNQMTIASGGNVGINTNAPNQPLHVNGTARVNQLIVNEVGNTYNGMIEVTYNDAGNYGIALNDTNTGAHNAGAIQFFNTGTGIGAVSTTNTGVSYNTTSDRRLKENIKPSAKGLDDLMKIEINDFNFIHDPDKTRVQGFIAQDLYKIYPEAVTVGGDDVKKRAWAVDYGRVTPLIVKAIQQLKTLIDQITAHLTTHDDQIKQLQDMVKAQQQQIDDLKKQIQKINGGASNDNATPAPISVPVKTKK